MARARAKAVAMAMARARAQEWWWKWVDGWVGGCDGEDDSECGRAVVGFASRMLFRHA